VSARGFVLELHFALRREDALESIGVEVTSPENLKYLATLLYGSLVGATDDGEVSIAQPITFKGSTGSGGDRLKRGKGSTNEGSSFWISCRGEDSPPLISDHCLHMMY
jgi:hypothetical protein